MLKKDLILTNIKFSFFILPNLTAYSCSASRQIDPKYITGTFSRILCQVTIYSIKSIMIIGILEQIQTAEQL